MSENQNDNEKFQSDFEDNKNSDASDPVEVDQNVVVPDHTDVAEDDSAEPADADVQHKVSANEVDKAEGSESSA